MGNHCCRPVPFLRGRGSAFVDAISDRDLVDWRVVERDERGDGENGDGGDNGNNNGLTIILNLFETSKIARTTTWLRSNSHMIRHVLMGRPRSPNDPDHDDDDDDAQQQPNWSSPAMQQLFVAIGEIPKLEVLLLNEVGSSENPMPIRFLSSVLHKRHDSLKQAYLSGHFQGDQDDCETFATRIAQQSQLQCFALYGNAQREFNLDPILQAASTLPLLKDLHFHANMPHPIANQTIVQVGRMAHLEKLTLHSCDIAGDNMATLGETLLQSATALRELTVFEAFCPNFAQLHSHDDEHDDSHHQHSSLIALTNLLRDSLSLRKVQIWFGFASNTAILVPFATQALAHNPRITHFNTALLWTPKYYDEAAIQAYVDMLAHSNTTIQQLHIYKYTGIWRLALHFYLRLNQTGRRDFCNGCETSMTTGEWIDTVLTAIPPVKADVRDDTYYAANNNLSFLEDEPDGWFEISWLYYYLRLQPSIIATAAAPPRRERVTS